ELGAHLLNRVDPVSDEPIIEAGLGRVDLLFTLLRRLKIDTPAQLAPYLEALHGNLEIRPLAEQIIDALLAEDESRYDVYRTIQEETGGRGAERGSGDQDVYRQVGLFMARWVELENLVRTMTSTDDLSARAAPVFRLLERVDLLDAGTRRE